MYHSHQMLRVIKKESGNGEIKMQGLLQMPRNVRRINCSVLQSTKPCSTLQGFGKNLWYRDSVVQRKVGADNFWNLLIIVELTTHELEQVKPIFIIFTNRGVHFI